VHQERRLKKVIPDGRASLLFLHEVPVFVAPIWSPTRHARPVVSDSAEKPTSTPRKFMVLLGSIRFSIATDRRRQ
jgi:hypothetical protein